MGQCGVCGGARSSNRAVTRITKVSSDPCKALRKEMIKIKNKAYSRHKLNGMNAEDLEVFNQITSDLRDLKYCPEQEVVDLYKEEYGL